MKIFLIRHGIAADPADYQEDRLRPLTADGKLKTVRIAKRLCELDIRFDLILTSPFLRAKQTSDILASLAQDVRMTENLAPYGTLEDFLKEIQSTVKVETLALVGHQPNLGNWAEQMVWGSTQEKLTLKKAGIIGIEKPMTEDCMGDGKLFLLVSPKWIL